MSTSTNTGTSPFWTIGLTVVGNDVAVVMTSSPGCSRRSPSFGLVSAETARRFADEPELTSEQWRTPHQAANSDSNRRAKRPVVSQKSSVASASAVMSSASKTRPAHGTGLSPGVKGRSGCAAAW